MKRIILLLVLGLLLIAPSDYNSTVPYGKGGVYADTTYQGEGTVHYPGASTPIERRGTKSDFTPMYNPASRYCLNQGYRLEFQEGELGQIGTCINEPLECPEWAFFTGICSLDLGLFDRIK